MLVRGVLEKRSADGSWRARAFELTEKELVYMEQKAGKKSLKRACIPSIHLGSVALRKDGVLIVYEVGGAYAHYVRSCEQLEHEKMPSIQEWESALLHVLATRPLPEQYCNLGIARSENGAPLRIFGPLLKKGGSRGSVFTKTRRPSLSGGRRNWKEREFLLDFEAASLEYREKGDNGPRGVIRLRPGSLVQAPDQVRLRGRHAEPLRDGTDEDPLYFEVKNTLDSEGRPRDVFAIRALKRRDFDEWIIALSTCIARLKVASNDLCDSARDSLLAPAAQVVNDAKKMYNQDDSNNASPPQASSKLPVNLAAAIPRLPFFTRSSEQTSTNQHEECLNSPDDSSSSSSSSSENDDHQTHSNPDDTSFDDRNHTISSTHERSTTSNFIEVRDSTLVNDAVMKDSTAAAACLTHQYDENSPRSKVHEVSVAVNETASTHQDINNDKPVDVAARIRALTLASNDKPVQSKSSSGLNSAHAKNEPPSQVADKIASLLHQQQQTNPVRPPPPRPKASTKPPPPPPPPKISPTVTPTQCIANDDISKVQQQPSFKKPPPPSKINKTEPSVPSPTYAASSTEGDLSNKALTEPAPPSFKKSQPPPPPPPKKNNVPLVSARPDAPVFDD